MKMKRMKYKWQSYKGLKYCFLLSIEYMFCRQVKSFYRWLYRHRMNREELADNKFKICWEHPYDWGGGYGVSTRIIPLFFIHFFVLMGMLISWNYVGGFLGLIICLISMPFWMILDPSAHPVHKEFLGWPHERRRRWCIRSLRILAFLLFFPWTVKLLLWLTGNESFVTLLMKIWG